MNLYDLENSKPSRKKIAEAGYGQNRGYAQGFASPNAPSLGGSRGRDSEGNSEFDDKMRKLTGMIFYNVNDPEMASALGLKQTRTGKWFLRTGNRNAQQAADRAFGAGKVWYPKNEGVVEGEEMGTFAALKGLKSWQVVIMNNYYRGKYSDYSGRYYYVLATSPEEAKQVVLDNADGILQDLLSMKSHNGKKILPRGSAVRITPERIGKIEDGTVAGRMSTAGFKRMFGPEGVTMAKLSGGAVVDMQGQGQGVAEDKSHELDSLYNQYDELDYDGNSESDREQMRFIQQKIRDLKAKQGVTEMDGDSTGRSDGEFSKEHTGKQMKAKDAVKHAAKWLTEPQGPKQELVRNRAKNIANIRKNKGVAEGRLNEFAEKPEDGPGSNEYEDLLFNLAYHYWEGDSADFGAARKLSLLGWKPEYGDDYTAIALYKIGSDGSGENFRSYTIDEFEDFEQRMNGDEQGVAEGVAETMSMNDAVKVLRQYGADNFKTTSNELHFYKNGRPLSVDLIFNDDATRSVSISSLNSATRQLKGRGVAEGQLNEYLVKAGMPVQDVLALNLFQDFDPVEGAAAQFPEFAEEPMWQQVVRKYAPIAKMLEKKLVAQKRPLTDAEAEAVEQTWYDGSDAYDDVEIEYLVDIYDQQIDTLEALLAGNLTDEEFDEARANTAGTRAGLARRANAVPLSPEEQAAKDKAKSDKWLEKERAKMAAKKGVAENEFNNKPDNWSQDFERRMSNDNNGFDTHIVMVTVSDPGATAVTQRGETVQKRARVRANDRETAINMAINHYKKAGYRVQDHHYVGAVRSGATPRNEDNGLNELSNDLLGRYKKELGIRASAADKAGDYEKGNEYFKKINKATIRQGDNDARKHEREEQNEMMETRLNMMRKAGYDL